MANNGNTLGYAAIDESGHLAPFKFDRRDVGPNDVEFRIAYCGMCHSDVHTIKSEWGRPSYPIVPGHELVGYVTHVGADVTKFSVGQAVGVGTMVRSCQEASCDGCSHGLEQYCPQKVWTYNNTDIDGTVTQGGYSNRMVCDQSFVLAIPPALPLADSAPLLCAGITVFSPMKHFGMDVPGKKLGVLGLGGLGHMAVKFGKAFGLSVTILSSTASKEKEAREGLGADGFVHTRDEEAMKAAIGTLDYIVDTVSAPHDIPAFMTLLKVDGKFVMVGLPPQELKVRAASFVTGRKMLAGSLVGGVKETEEMLAFCAEHNILPQVEKIPIDYVNTAVERMLKSDIKYRFVIDIEGSLKDTE